MTDDERRYCEACTSLYNDDVARSGGILPNEVVRHVDGNHMYARLATPAPVTPTLDARLLDEVRREVRDLACVQLKDEVIRQSHKALDYPHDASRETVYRLEVLEVIDQVAARLAQSTEAAPVDPPTPRDPGDREAWH